MEEGQINTENKKPKHSQRKISQESNSSYKTRNNLTSEIKVKSLDGKKKSRTSGKWKVKNNVFLKNELSPYDKEDQKGNEDKDKQLFKENGEIKKELINYKKNSIEIVKNSDNNLLNKLKNNRNTRTVSISNENIDGESVDAKESSDILKIMREFKRKMREEKSKTSSLKTLIEEQQKKIKSYQEKYNDVRKKNESLVKQIKDLKLANKESHANITIKEENSILFNDSKNTSNTPNINTFTNEMFQKISEENKKLKADINEEKVKNEILKIIAEDERKKIKGLKELIIKEKRKNENSKEKDKKENDIDKKNRNDEIKNLNKTIKELKEQLSSANENYKSKEFNYVNNINILNEKIKKLKQEIYKLKNTITELNKTNKDINNKLQNYIIKYSNLYEKDRKTSSQKIIIDAKNKNQNLKITRGFDRKMCTGRFGSEEAKELGAIIKEEISKKEKQNMESGSGDNNETNLGMSDYLILNDEEYEEEDDENSDDDEFGIENKKESENRKINIKNGEEKKSKDNENVNKNEDNNGEDNIKIHTILET